MQATTIKRVLIITVLGTLTACAGNRDARADVDSYSHRGDCNGAEARARVHFSGEYLLWYLGNIARYCRNDRAMAISYYKYAANLNSEFSQLAAESLLSMGETAPTPPPRPVIVQPYVVAPQRDSISCVSTKDMLGTVRMNCN